MRNRWMRRSRRMTWNGNISSRNQEDEKKEEEKEKHKK